MNQTKDEVKTKIRSLPRRFFELEIPPICPTLSPGSRSFPSAVACPLHLSTGFAARDSRDFPDAFYFLALRPLGVVAFTFPSAQGLNQTGGSIENEIQTKDEIIIKNHSLPQIGRREIPAISPTYSPSSLSSPS